MDKLRFSEQLFEFPLIVYDAVELGRALKRDEESFAESKTEVSYAIGKAKILPNTVKGYYEAYTRDRSIDEILDEGFNCTAVLTEQGDFLCSWKIGEFENKYNKHIDKLEAYLEELRIEEMKAFEKTEYPEGCDGAMRTD